MDNTNRSIYGFSSPFPLPFPFPPPFPFPFPFPNETPRRLPVHELQGVVSQSRQKKLWCIRSLPEFLYPIQLSANYLMHLVFFLFPTKCLFIKHRLDTVPLLLQSIVICYRLLVLMLATPHVGMVCRCVRISHVPVHEPFWHLPIHAPSRPFPPSNLGFHFALQCFSS